MSLVTNVFRRGGSYYFRTRVPAALQQLVGRKELWRSLRTPDARLARKRATSAALLTERLWICLEHSMSSSSELLTRAEIQTLVDDWLRAELDEDASLRRRTEQDREGEWFAGVIMERSSDGSPDAVVERLSEGALAALLAESDQVREARYGKPRYLIADVNEVHLERIRRAALYEESAKRFELGDKSLAAQHAADLLTRHGFQVPTDSDAFDIATRLMMRAHRDLLDATRRRDITLWRPILDDDPAEKIINRLAPSSKPDAQKDLNGPAASAPKSLSRRASLPFKDAAKDALIAISRTENFKPKRRDDYQNAIDTFVDWFGRDPALHEVTPEIAGDYQVALTQHPSRAAIRPAYRDLATFAERSAKAASLNEEQLLNPVTINGKYLTPLRRIYAWHKKAGSGLDNPFDGIAAPKPRKSDPRKARRDFTHAEVQRFLDLPAFTGAQAAHGSGSSRSGTVRIRDHRFWVPLICFFSGMRLNEACGLAIADMKEENGITFFHVRDEFEDQSVKANASRRKVPLHHELVRLGLIAEVRHWKASGRLRLFSELKADAKGYYSHGPSKLFNRWAKNIADSDPDDPGALVFHSSRHTVVTRLRAAHIRQDVSQEIVGHEAGDVHSGYGKVDLPTLKAAIDKIAYPGLDLSRLKF
jgi:integrase